MNECAFNTTDPIYIEYHDYYWGQPIYDSKELFKLMALESQHAGLSWLTILKKKESYEQAFYNFEPQFIAHMTEQDIVSQAKGYLKIEKDYGSFSKFLWSYVNHQPINMGYKKPRDRKKVDQRATQLSKDLKAYGFKFLGPVTVFSFLEAAGLYDSHLEGCPFKPNHE